MIYFSEIKNKRVVTENGVYIGRLEDFIFKAAEIPSITKFIVKDKKNKTLIIPINCLKKINSSINVLGCYHQTSFLESDELMVLRNLLDKQIIDLKGNKVVRVNDVVIQDKPHFMVSAVDVGILGILRWFSLAEQVKKLFGLEPNLLSWADIQPLELTHGKVILRKEIEKLKQIRPEDLAYYLSKTNLSNVKKIIKLLNQPVAANVIASLNINYQTELIRSFPLDKTVRFLSLIDPDEAVDILLALSAKRRNLILENLPPDKKNEISNLLRFSKTPIGGLITSQFITVDANDTVKKVIEIIRKKTVTYYFMNYVYILNKEKQLVGVVNLHELLLNNLDTPLYKFMTQNVITVKLTTPEEIAINKMLKYKIQALPVIDKDKHILGIVTLDDVAEFLLKKIR